jgi:hypothetical protein
VWLAMIREKKGEEGIISRKKDEKRVERER